MSLTVTPLFIYEIALCFILSVFFIRYKGVQNRLFPIFLLILLGVEYYCAYLGFLERPTNHIYNFWFPVEFIFYGYFISTHITSRIKALISYSLITTYLVFVIINYSLYENLKVFSSITFLLGCVFLIGIMLFKLYEIVNEEIVNNPFKNEMFWFIIGLLLVNLGGFFHFGAVNYLYLNNKALHSALQQLNVYLSEFQYVCFIIYFYCKWKFQK